MSLVYNAIRTPDGTLLESFSRWDYKSHTDTTNGKTYAIDGGYDYMRRIGSGFEELSVSLEDGHEAVRDAVKWGTYGINGDQPLSYIKLKHMDTSHIEAVIKILGVQPSFKEAMITELEYRNEG